MNINKLLFCTFVVCLASTAAAQGVAELRVGATVMARASLQSSTPAQLTVTADDVARGYVDVDNVAYSLRSNSLRGAVLSFTPMGELAQQTRVTGLSTPVQMGAGGGTVSLPRVPAQESAQGTFAFRFFLAPDTRPGQYPWPLQISAQPA